MQEKKFMLKIQGRSKIFAIEFRLPVEQEVAMELDGIRLHEIVEEIEIPPDFFLQMSPVGSQ